MGRWDRTRAFFGMSPAVPVEPPAPVEPARFVFSAPSLPVDQLLTHLYKGIGRIDRAAALSVPAVLRGRNQICGSISGLPLEAVGAANRVQDHPLLRQLDRNVPNSVTLAQTVEDLLFEAVAWWRIVERSSDGRPTSIVRYDPGAVSMTPPDNYREGYLPSDLPTHGLIWMGGEPVSIEQVIRFDSPNPALLVAGERAIKRAIALDRAADLYATTPQARGFFTPVEGVDPGTDDEITDMLDDFQAARAKRLDGYVPAALKYNAIQNPTPAEIQLIAQQQRADLAIANALGLDPEDLGINTTSRTYRNDVTRRQDKILDTYGPYMSAITDRLTMPDVTRRGVRVRFALGDYLKADPKTRAEIQAIYAGLGVTDAAEIRAAEGLPPRVVIRPAAPPRQVASSVGDPVREIEAAADAGHTFARETGLTFEVETDATFAVDTDARTITGLAVPWGQVGRSRGRRWRFARGSVRYSAVNRVKLLRDHINASAVGKAVSIDDTDAGLVVKFSVIPGPKGDEVLAEAAHGTLDGLSIGVDFRDGDFGPDPQNPGAFLVRQSALREVSLTAVPSFDDSRLTSVTASREGETMHECEHCHAQLTPGVAHTCPTPATDPVTDPVPGVTFNAETAAAFAAFLEQRGAADDPRPVVDPTTRPVATTRVREALPYKFSHTAGRHVFDRGPQGYDFSTDLFAAVNGDPGSGEALNRVNALIRAAFDVDQADTSTVLDPTRYRPDLWQPQMDYATPLWDMINSGATDGTPFDVPKYNSSSGLVSAATEGTEPAPGAMTVTSQTITPTQVWGKVEITRQAARRGGRPELSGIIWDQMLREYYEDREAAVATFLATLTAATDIALPFWPAAGDNDDDQAIASAMEEAITGLQFVRGGNRFRAFAVHQDLYEVFARVKDDAGRPLYPQINPQNANGTAANLFSTLNIAGTVAVPAWALGAGGQTDAVSSWLFDPAKVRGWASAPERLDWNFGATVQTANIPQLSHVTIGIYGDLALANLDINGVRQVTFDPVS